MISFYFSCNEIEYDKVVMTYVLLVNPFWMLMHVLNIVRNCTGPLMIAGPCAFAHLKSKPLSADLRIYNRFHKMFLWFASKHSAIGQFRLIENIEAPGAKFYRLILIIILL